MKTDRYPREMRNAFSEALFTGTNQRVGLLHHADADGVCAGVLLTNLLQLRGASVESRRVATADFDFESTFSWLRGGRYERVATLDINFLSTSGALEGLRDAAGCTVAVYDDHDPGDAPKAFEGLHYFNPHAAGLGADFHAPACGFAYALLEDGDLDGSAASLVCMIGLVGEGVAGSFGSEFTELKALVDRLRPIAYDLNSAFSLPDRHTGQDLPRKLLSEALRAEGASVSEILAEIEAHPVRQQLASNAAMIDEAVRRTVASLDRRPNVETASGLRVHLLHFANEYAIVNWVASQVRQRVKPGLVVAMQDMPNGRTQIEVRRSRGVKHPDASALLRSLDDQVAYISRGGHPPAAGATIPSTEVAAFDAALRRHAASSL